MRALGSLAYMAPEVLAGRQGGDYKADIWAMGWTFYELLYGTDPWDIRNVTTRVR